MKSIKRLFKTLLLLFLMVFAGMGIYHTYRQWQYDRMKTYVEAKESVRDYDPDLLYLLPRGEPIVLVNPNYTKTLFFVEGFRGQVGAGIYKEWLEDIHQTHKVNIITPIIGLQGWPFVQRNREWYFQEDMRQVLQIYDAYTATLPSDHRIVVASQSFGALSNLIIAAKGHRAPDAGVLMSPLNTRLVYRSVDSKLMKWLATQTHWLHYIIPYVKRGRNSKRAGAWDIVNDQKNLDTWEHVAKDIINWEENLYQSVLVKETATYMENQLTPKIRNRKFVLLYGDDDLYFSSAGFINLAQKLRVAGNIVEDRKLPKTGHMLLFDNGGDTAKKIILDLLENTYDIPNVSH